MTTYAVGELSAINGLAGAFAERVPVVAITGAPSTAYFKSRTCCTTPWATTGSRFKMFGHVTVASTLLEDGESAPAEIDRVLSACLEQQQPVYICACPPMSCGCGVAAPRSFAPASGRPVIRQTLQEAIDEASAMLNAAGRPVVIGDVELIRYGLQTSLPPSSNRPVCPTPR